MYSCKVPRSRMASEVRGGMWDEIGRLQFSFLVQQGLLPHHYFLDVGCGALRGGIHFIRYLEPRHYYGVDQNQDVLEAARKVELRRHGLAFKNPTLFRNDTFEFQALGQSFDYALAQSVFIHLPLNYIIRCVMNIEKVLVPGGRFFATFFENPQGKFNLEPVWHFSTDGADFPSFFDKDAFHYDFHTFEWICEGTALKVEYIGDWNHPRDQKMLVFVKQ
jgi:SAM-dependent methyltransferase